MMPSAGSPPLVLPRGLIFVACLWILGSWLLAMGLNTPVQPTSSSFTPGVTMMLTCVSIGMMIGWPLMRLSQEPPAYPIRQTLLDIVVMTALLQVVLWPVRLVTAWPVARTAAIDLALLGWMVLLSAVICAVIGSSRTGPRALAMLACVMLALIGPGVALFSIAAGHFTMGLIELSPLLVVQTLGRGGGSFTTEQEWTAIILLWSAAIIVWGALLASRALFFRFTDPGGARM